MILKRRFTLIVGALLAAGALAGCATVGKNFPEDAAARIVLNQTTRAQIEKELGAPFRTGLDSGNPTVTYLYYRFGLFADPITKDLTITYTPQNTVKAYTFNSNAAEVESQEQENRSKEYNQR